MVQWARINANCLFFFIFTIYAIVIVLEIAKFAFKVLVFIVDKFIRTCTTAFRLTFEL